MLAIFAIDLHEIIHASKNNIGNGEIVLTLERLRRFDLTSADRDDHAMIMCGDSAKIAE